MFNEELKNFNYYWTKVPLYLRNSYGYETHFRLLYDIMVSSDDKAGFINCTETLLEELNVFDDDYLSYIASFVDSGAIYDEEKGIYTDYGSYSDILDKLGSLYGVNRHFNVTYTKDGRTIEKNISLNNEDFLTLIKIQIIRYNCEGSYEQMAELYSSIHLYMYIQNTGHAEITARLVVEENTSQDIIDMFLAGMLTIKPMGVDIIHDVVENVEAILIWDAFYPDKEKKNGWDDGVWVL